MATPLDDTALQQFLKAHPGWRHEANALVCTFEFGAFLQGLRFVQSLGQLAEAADHHPDIDVRWRKVTLRFTTHDAGNRVTDLDTRLAHEAELIARTTA
ncbi:MAG: 4a-hydroxytetrahydrobiopterin dehydratase [Archangium sp.]|nr:4a-hydroxytetrahydrobiopterin dehydratase [Archangium sp.]